MLLQATLKQKEAELDVVAPYSKSYGRTLVRTILESEGGGVTLVRAAVYNGLCLGGAISFWWLSWAGFEDAAQVRT